VPRSTDSAHSIGTFGIRAARSGNGIFLNSSVDKLESVAYVVLNDSVEQGGGFVADDQLSRVFAALADPTRRDMVARLAAGDATVGELADPYDVSLQAVSKHVKVLADAGLVTQTRHAQRRPCHLEAEVFDLMTKWIERYREQAQQRYDRLDDVLAEVRGEERADDLEQGAAS
jgi:DNA-binding transcriptional ArsR family regulator